MIDPERLGLDQADAPAELRSTFANDAPTNRGSRRYVQTAKLHQMHRGDHVELSTEVTGPEPSTDYASLVSMTSRLVRLAAFAAGSLVASCADRSARAPDTAASQTTAASGRAPDSFRVAFTTSRGPFVVEITRAWAPRGADRFYTLVNQRFFDDSRFFRVVPGFVVQFGLNANPQRNEPWDSKRLLDDSVTQSNVRGTITFATEGPNTRTHQLFINLGDNRRLDAMGFAPLGRVVEGMSVVDSLYGGYGESPDQQLIQTVGNSYLDRAFPKLDRIETARVVEPSGRPKPGGAAFPRR
jgi:peptidyl-prolyl cis-trans isomerase A (cyclophilin A)